MNQFPQNNPDALSDLAKNPDKSICPGCKAKFQCNAGIPNSKCWCFDVEKVDSSVLRAAQVPAGQCLCSSCLMAFVKKGSSDAKT